MYPNEYSVEGLVGSGFTCRIGCKDYDLHPIQVITALGTRRFKEIISTRSRLVQLSILAHMKPGTRVICHRQ